MRNYCNCSARRHYFFTALGLRSDLDIFCVPKLTMISAGDGKDNKPVKKCHVQDNMRVSSKQTKKDDLGVRKFYTKQFQSISKDKEAIDLVARMVERLHVFENELQDLKSDLKEAKDTIQKQEMYIAELEKNILLKSQNCNSTSRQENGCFDLPDEFYKLKHKVKDIERFLFDYCPLQVKPQDKFEGSNGVEDWINMDYTPDFDVIIGIIEGMNLENSEPQIIHTDKGARLQICDVLSLTLYANGMISGDTPFRPYSEISARAYFHDLKDGFYPAELQANNPEGVIFKVCDKRNKVYKHQKKISAFGGHGIKLGADLLKPKSYYDTQIQNMAYGGVWQPLVSVAHSNDVRTVQPVLCYPLNTNIQPPKHQISKTLKIKNGVISKLADKSTTSLKTEQVQVIELNKPTGRTDEITLKIHEYKGEPVYIVSVLIQDTIGSLLKVLPIESAYRLAYRDDRNSVKYLSVTNATFKHYGICRSCALFAAK